MKLTLQILTESSCEPSAGENEGPWQGSCLGLCLTQASQEAVGPFAKCAPASSSPETPAGWTQRLLVQIPPHCLSTLQSHPICVLVGWGKTPQAGWLKATEISSLSTPDMGDPRCRCWQPGSSRGPFPQLRDGCCLPVHAVFSLATCPVPIYL